MTHRRPDLRSRESRQFASPLRRVFSTVEKDILRFERKIIARPSGRGEERKARLAGDPVGVTAARFSTRKFRNNASKTAAGKKSAKKMADNEELEVSGCALR